MYSSAYFGVLSMELVSYYPSGMYTFNEAHMFFWKTCRPQATCNKNYSPNMNHAALYHTYLKLLSWPDHLTHKKQVSFLQLLLLLRNQGPGHTPQMHHSLKAYCATLFPPYVLGVPTFATRCLHVLTTREIQAAKGGTLWVRILASNFA